MNTKTTSTSTSGGGGLRDLWTSVAHLQPPLLPPPSPSPSPSAPTSLRSSLGTRHSGRRARSRIRSWIGHDRDHKDKVKDREASDDEFQFVDGNANTIGASGASYENQTTTQAQRKRGQSESALNPHDHSRIPSQTQTYTHTHTLNGTYTQAKPKQNEAQETMQLTPDELREEETVDMLTGLMGDGFDRDVARRILRKYDGNVDKAAGALVEGERGDELEIGHGQGGVGQMQISVHNQSQGWAASAPIQMPMTQTQAQALTQVQTRLATSSGTGAGTDGALARRPNTPVIDLTQDEDADLQRAMQESMSTLHAHQVQAGSQMQAYTQAQLQSQAMSQVQVYATPQGQPPSERPVFGPSERPPDPNWALVPSHQNETNDANYLQNLNRAIEASLETMGDSDALEPFPVEQQLRRDGCPVVLRPSMHTMVYAASILQGLFYVPQVRERMASWRPPMLANEEEVAPPMNGPDFTLWALSEIFTHMDLARLCDLNVDKRLSAFNIEPWDKPAQPPGELSRKFSARLSATLEKAFVEQFAFSGQPLPKPRILHFQYGSGISEPGELLQETSIVPIDVNGGESNDLIGRLSAQLSKPQSEPHKQIVIFEPSEVVAFELVRSTPSTTTTAGPVDRKLFTYPKSIYLDQFLRENVEVAQAKRTQRQDMLKEVQQLVSQKHTLTHFDGKDTLKDLRSTIFYFENVAEARDDPERAGAIQATTRKLKSILTTIEEGIKATDERITTLRTQAETLLECEELQQYKYDLRVVFVHDGLYGRKHLYSYVQDKSCWWKIADSLIDKVPEELVLGDQAGLHLGAGPYLLFYSRATEEGPAPVLPWMDDIKDDVKIANREFLSQLPPELVGDIVIDEEDVSFSGADAVKKSGTGERMDVS